jgi:hypothetical protein
MSKTIQRTSGQKQMRSPQPSIKSSQMFSQQQQQQQSKVKSTQQPQYQQQQHPQQQYPRNHSQSYQLDQQDYQEDVNGKKNFTKITIAQAITLITLRLGSLETKLMGVDTDSNELSNASDGTNILERLDALENKFNTSMTADYKQQIDQLMQSIIQQKNLSNSIAKDNKDIKTQLNSLKKEIIEMNQLIETIRNMSISNESKIFELLNTDVQYDELVESNDTINCENIDFNLSDDDEVSNNSSTSLSEQLEPLETNIN